MSVDKKKLIKKAVISWLCFAALTSGLVPGSFSGIIPTITAAAEATDSYLAEIDLTKLPEYEASNVPIFDGNVSVEVTNNNGEPLYTVCFNETGSYRLSKSNYINDCYCDVQFLSRNDANVTLVCDDVYIRNDDGLHELGVCGNEHYYTITPFAVINGSMKLTGKLAVDTFCCDECGEIVDFKDNDVNAEYFAVTYQDENDKVIGKSYYLTGSTYSDKSEVPSRYACVTSNGALFDYTNISAAATVICDDHSLDASGKCQTCGEVYLVDLAKLVEYKNGTAECPYGLSFNTPENFSDILEVTFTKSGTYKLTGSNFINGAYLDIKFIIADGVNVTLDCDDAFIKNDKGVLVTHKERPEPLLPDDEPVYSAELGASGKYTLYNYVHPFLVNGNGTVNFTGKLFVDTFRYELSMVESDTPINNISEIYYYHDNVFLDRNYFVSGTEYNLSDYALDFHCIEPMYGISPGDYTFSSGVVGVNFYMHHSIPDGSDTCSNCGQTFDTIYTVKIGGETKRVAAGDTIDRPADPTAPLGQKFKGWYVGDTEYDFSKPVTSNITLTAHYEDCLIKSVAVKTAPTKTAYIEGNDFKPTGLVITVTYEDDRTEDIEYSENNTKFSFSPALTEKLTTTDRYVTVSYGTAMQDGSNSDDIPIIVDAKQLSSIAVKTAPTKITYIEGNTFDPAGLVITLTYDNGDTEDVAYSSATASKFLFSKGVFALGDNTVTITYGGKSTTQTVTVAAKQLTSVTVKTAPTKITYIEGNTFDPAGLVITLHYDNDTTEDVTYNATTASDFTFDKTELALGDSSVEITYSGKSVTQSVTQAVTVAAKKLTSVTVKTAPKTNYIEGNDFDPTGLVITLHYDNDTTEDVTYNATTASDFKFDKTELAYGDTAVQITYDGKSVEQTITVAAKQLTSVTVKTAPTKITYIEGNTFDPTGLVITLHYDNNTTEDVTYNATTASDFTFDKTELALGDTSVEITYGVKSVTQAVTVAAKQLTSVTVKTAPTKISYIEGNTFDPTGLVITLHYDNDTTEDVTYNATTASDFTFDKTELAYGDTAVQITYDGKSIEQTITVAAKQLTSVTVKTAPTKITYIEGNTFDPTGLVITLHYDNDTTEDVTYNATTASDFTFDKTELAYGDTAVQITYDGKSIEQTITVAAKQLTSVTVKTAPTKITYIEGNTFDPTGLVITLHYDNDTTEDVTYNATTASEFKFDKTELAYGDTAVQITYDGKSVEQTITVAAKQLTSVTVKTAPTKITYIEGNDFDPTGLVITLHYDNNTTEDVTYNATTASDFTFDKTELALGDTSVDITYGGKSVEQTITVAAKQLTSVTVKTAPTKITYIEGNTFDPAELVITLHYDNNTTEDVTYNATTASDFKFDKTELALGDTAVQITYGGKSVTQAVTVAAKQLTIVTVKTAPTKISYIEGNTFDPTGLVITLHYDNNTTEDVIYNETTASDFKFDKTELAYGDTAVQIIYDGKSVTQAVTVAEKQLTSVTVKTAPTKITYIDGNTFDPTGLVITLHYDNNTTEDVIYNETTASDFKFNVSEKLTTNDTKVTVEYSGKTAEIEITVTSNGDIPQIKGDDGKTGWDSIISEIINSKNGDKVIVDMNGVTLLPSNVLEAIAGKDTDLVLDMGNGFTWTIKGNTVTDTAEVDMGVNKGNNIPIEVINLLTGERMYISISLEHDGPFGFNAILTVNMGAQNNGNYANLYYYNESNNTMEFISSGLIGENGDVGLLFSHASEYVILIDDHDHGKASGGENENPPTGFAMSYAVLLASGAVVFITRKKKNK